jgi:hypothetical protein
MRMRTLLVMVCAMLLGANAWGLDVTLDNADIETNPGGEFTSIGDWGPNGAWAYHADFPKPNNGSLGASFGYYSAGSTEIVAQLTDEIISADTIYDFWSWAIGGGNDTGTVPYQIGYAATAGDVSSFVLLASNAITVTGNGQWLELAGVSYTTGATGDEIGKELIVRLGDLSAGGDSDIWFDNFQATATPVPEPGLIAVAAFAVLLRLRRKK